MAPHTATHHFLQGGGEMGLLTREYDWSQTSLGMPGDWPLSLRTTVGIVLHSAFPMFLFWGPDLICFYNDAFRPSLGNNGKHPAYGKRGVEVWAEIWDFIGPLINKVMATGEPVWFEDQLVPFYRNGRMEDIYWTFSYSPAYGDDGCINGVFVTCTETTASVLNTRRLEAANQQFSDLVMQAPVAIAVFRGPDFVAETVNDAYLPIVGKTREEFVGKPLFQSLPETRAILEPIAREVVRTGERFHGSEFELVIHRNGRNDTCYFNSVWEPLHEHDGSINGFIVVAHEVTGMVVARKNIEESEERFRTMAESADILIAVGDASGNATYFNKAWTDLTGRPMTDLLAFGWADLVHAEDRDRYVNIYLSALNKLEPFTGEFRVLNASGKYDWLLARGVPRFGSGGAFAGYISSCLNITTRKNAEEALKESELRIRAIVESAPFPIGVYIGREMRIALTNQSILDTWGKGNDVIGKTYAEILPELADQHIYQQLDQVYTTGIPFHARNQRVDIMIDGGMKAHYFNYSFTPLFDAAGNVYGVTNTAANVTDIVVAKQMVEQSERNIRNMVLQAPVAMCILMGPDHIVEVVNKEMLEIWGKPVAEVMQRPIFDVLPEAREQGLQQVMSAVYNTGEPFTGEEHPVVLLRNGSHDTVYQNFVYEPYRDADGAILGVLAISIDVTAQVRARHQIEDVVAERTRELAEANTSLARSNAELAQFAYIASHDLQEPIRKVSTFAQMLGSSLTGIDDRSRTYLDKIGNSAARMITLIRDILAYSQLAKDNDVFETVDLDRIAGEILSDFELLIEQKKAHINYDGLPVIEAIPLQMSQLFSNLISNSLKFCRSDVRPRITITTTPFTRQEPGENNTHIFRKWYNIEFRDNGIGFSPEYAAQVFHIFQRLHGRSEYAGTGIGLAMCRKIAENHHGEIFATATTQEGAVINVLLPQKQEVAQI